MLATNMAMSAKKATRALSKCISYIVGTSQRNRTQKTILCSYLICGGWNEDGKKQYYIKESAENHGDLCDQMLQVLKLLSILLVGNLPVDLLA